MPISRAQEESAARPTSAPITIRDDAEYEYLCECRCLRLPGTHTAGQCLSMPMAS